MTDKAGRVPVFLLREGVVLSSSILLVVVLWSATCLAIAALSGLFRSRRLPATRHLRRVRTDPQT